jgi:hypothetical protein
MRLGSAARVAATATGIIALVYVVGVIVLNLVVSARLAQQNDNRLADRLAAAGHDPDVLSQPAARAFRAAGDGDAGSAPVFFWLLDARQAATAQSPGAPALPGRPLSGVQPRDGLAVTVNAGRAGPFRLEMTRDGSGWLVAGQSLAGVAHTRRLLLYAEVLAGPFVLMAMFLGCLVVGQRALAPAEQSRRRQLVGRGARLAGDAVLPDQRAGGRVDRDHAVVVVVAYPVIEPGSWVMERKMLLTIKQLAERLARTQPAG